MNREKSNSLYDKAQNLMPAGVNSPVRAFRSVGAKPVFMQKGHGAHVCDVDGNDYIDYCMSWGPLILGHADPDVIQAITDCAQNGTSFGTPHPFEVALAEAVIDRFAGIEKIRFVNSGTEATMSAIRLARGYTGRDKIIKFDGCYHGHADHLLVAGGSGLATFGVPDSAGVTKNNAADTIIAPFNDLHSVAALVEKEKHALAAIILEPVPCNYGLIQPDMTFLLGLRKICDMYGILLIFDEVITGFRLARGGAQEYYNVRADITTLGKIIGGGLPVGAYGASKEIMAMIAPDGTVYQAGTLSGNPLAMIAGLTTLQKLDASDAYAVLRNKAEKFQAMLQPVLDAYSDKVLFVSLESIFAFYFTGNKAITTLGEVKQSDMNLFAAFHREMLQRGIYLSPSGYEVGFLSTAHTGEDLEKTVLAVKESFAAIF